MALKFTGHKSYEEIKQDCAKRGFQFWDDKYKQGSDYVTFNFHNGRTHKQIVYSTVNGNFIASDPDNKDSRVLYTERSTEMDNVVWYRRLLLFIYKNEVK